MKLFSRKNISILLITATIIGLMVSIYYALQKYAAYEEFEKAQQQKILFQNSNVLLKRLEKERLRSTLYLTNPNQKTLNKLNQQRRRVNEQIKKNKNLNLDSEIQALLQIRKNVNNLSLNYHQIIFDAFHTNIINSIFIKMEKLKNLPAEQNQLQLIKLRENINMEDSFLAYILNQNKRMEEDDMLFWDQILNLRQLPTFTSIKNENLLSHIEDIYATEDFSKITDTSRVQLFISATQGNYPLTFQEWYNKTSEQQKKLSRIQKLLTQANDDPKMKPDVHKDEMYESIIISLLILILLGLLFGLLRILQKINKDQTILTNTVKEIEVDLDENKKREIKEILTHNSSVEVYEFLAKEIKEPSRAKDLFLANMSHEIRTPLNGILGFTKELKETRLSEEQSEIVEIIEESSKNLFHIVNDILDFSKIKAGKIELEKIAFNPIEKFEASIDTYIARAREKEIELKVGIDPKIPTQVLGDPTKVIQILNNLISNAIKFTPKKGMIEIDIKETLKSQHQQSKNVNLLFSVKDSGIGISSSQKKKIFEAFSQADISTSRKYGGTGLGLSIASQLIEHMGGQLNIDSQVGEGATFFFALELEIPKKIIVRSKKNLQGYKVGYIPPTDNRSIDKTLKTYVEYQNATFLTYTQRTLLNLREEDLPDLLFIDYKCFSKEGELDYFLDLPLKLVLIIADNREEELFSVREKIDKVLHKPVNFTRTLKALEILTQNQKTTLPLTKKETNLLKRANVLVAEDNRINQKLMQSVLSRLGVDVTLVGNGEEALALRKKNHYDMIFMDIQMPIMGGVEATRNILSFEKNSNKKHVPIVALTANALEGDKEKYMSVGMDAYLAKPMNVDELKKVLKNFID